jgi:hypothetical protein
MNRVACSVGSLSVEGLKYCLFEFDSRNGRKPETLNKRGRDLAGIRTRHFLIHQFCFKVQIRASLWSIVNLHDSYRHDIS